MKKLRLFVMLTALCTTSAQAETLCPNLPGSITAVSGNVERQGDLLFVHGSGTSFAARLEDLALPLGSRLFVAERKLGEQSPELALIAVTLDGSCIVYGSPRTMTAGVKKGNRLGS